LTRILSERTQAPKGARGKGAPSRVFISDMVLECSIGIHPHEHDKPQRVRINVDLWVGENPAPIDDDIVNVVSYEDIVREIETTLGRGHINLIETAAERIAELCLADRRVILVRVRFEKLDVFTNVASAGVEIERGRAESSSAGAFQVVPAP
jgi:dihydroneopterin aldolase